MNTTLTKIELQDMLREMGVNFSHEESHETLMEMFKQENHRRWLGAVRNQGASSRASLGRNKIRRRRGTITQSITPPPLPSVKEKVLSIFKEELLAASKRPAEKPVEKKIEEKFDGMVESVSEKTKPQFAEPESFESKSFERETFDQQPVMIDKDALLNLEKQLMKRAHKSCELCLIPFKIGEDSHPLDFNIFYITKRINGGRDTLKNTVALCGFCNSKVSKDPSKMVLTTLKKKARSRVLPPLVVMKKGSVSMV